MTLTLKHALAVIMLVLSFAAPVAAGPYEDAVAAHARGEYATVLRFIRPLAEQGYVNAQFDLGSMYVKGQGVPQDYAEAQRWFRLAADKGNVRAQTRLGIMYAEAQGVPQNYVEARRWFRLAADQGHDTA
jgi:uncharacterized protein